MFAPKYRRKEIYCKIKVDISKILRKLWKIKDAEIIEGNACLDYIHLYVSIPPNTNLLAVFYIIKLLKLCPCV